MTVVLDGGTTAPAVAGALEPGLEATVVTHSSLVASALIGSSVGVYLIGERLFHHSGVTSGAAAAEAVAGVSADLFLLGVTGLHEQAGVTTGDADEAAMKRLLCRAAETWGLASAEKMGVASPFTVVPLDEVAGVITDAAADNPTVVALEFAGVSVRR